MFGQIKYICTHTEPQHVVQLRPVYYHKNILEVWLTTIAKENM